MLGYATISNLASPLDLSGSHTTTTTMSISSALTLTPAEVAVALVEQAVAKHNTRLDKTFFKAVLAGVMLSFGGLLDLIISGGSPGLTTSNPGIVKVLGGLVFPVGLVMIVLQGFDLLTSNLMTFPMAALKRAIPWWGVPLNWIVVFFGNLVGSLFFAAILSKYDGLMVADPYASYVRSFAITKAITPAWYQILLRGIGCNWLVCIAVWQGMGAKETLSKIIAIWFPVWVFVACGFDHVIANMFSLPLSIMLHSELTTDLYIRKSLIAALIGNIIGGLFVGLPAVYFYLDDWHAGGMRDAEEARLERKDSGPSDSEKSA
ncbi:putative formate/nitrite transporter [Suillus fuscotomentosus]|uniref:Formate/nitrite transporter n=1 Tax=Suillus fuscotomentosus TaxID=1912939 RepID=A0AAD4E1J7_9AGAM|nr:putative formate/nitrite transporter [Suillus fuscotomentosus]KAG1897996.1 putative formate/nitrite transporter [Suillus fuscotomentosus]